MKITDSLMICFSFIQVVHEMLETHTSVVVLSISSLQEMSTGLAFQPRFHLAECGGLNVNCLL